MTGIRALAAAYGVRIELGDLGDWGRVRLIAEYDPNGPVIRVNRRELGLIPRRAQGDVKAGDRILVSDRILANDRILASDRILADDRAVGDVERAIAHELYHHREAIGEIPRLRDRAAREAAADAYAESLFSAPSMPRCGAGGG
jgi:hypothetical protein